MNNKDKLVCTECGNPLDLELTILHPTKGAMCKTCYNKYMNNFENMHKNALYFTQLCFNDTSESIIPPRNISIRMFNFFNGKEYTPEDIHFSIEYTYTILNQERNISVVEPCFINIKESLKYAEENNIDTNVFSFKDFFDIKVQKHPTPVKRLEKSILTFLKKKEKEFLKNESILVTHVIELDIENYIINNIELFEEGMTVIENQYHVKEGIMDILAKDKNDKLCIIELKNNPECDRLHRQCRDYPKHFSRRNIPFRMIAIAPDYTKEVFEDIKSFGYVEMYKFNIEYGNINNPVKKLEYIKV